MSTGSQVPVRNTIYTGDCLDVMRGMNSEMVDLIYLDPPFNSKRMYSAPIGSKAAGTSFKDMWTWDDVNEAYLQVMAKDYPNLTSFIYSIEGIHSKAMAAYIMYMTQRLIECHRVLKSTGSLYLHCDPTASHYLKLVLDRLFGKDKFRNEIIWCYGLGGSSRKMYSRKHDVILFYTKTDKYYFDKPMVAATSQMMKGQMKGINDYWTDIPSINNMAKERTGYPTQKPLDLLRRIIEASSNEGDVVMDPFCGCATTLVAAHEHDRKWIGVDLSEKSVEMVFQRITESVGDFLTDYIHLDGEMPSRTDIEMVKPSDSQVKKSLYGEQGGKCNGCNAHMEIRHFEVDHIIPRSKGGQDCLENYQLLCGNCNRIKGDKPMEYLRMRMAEYEKERVLNTYA